MVIVPSVRLPGEGRGPIISAPQRRDKASRQAARKQVSTNVLTTEETSVTCCQSSEYAIQWPCD